MAKAKILGKYIVKATEYAFDGGTATKAPQAIVKLLILEGQHAGSTKMYYGSFHEKCQEYTCEALRALGMSNDDVTKPEGLGSRKAEAVERENNYTPTSKPRIDFINSIEAKKITVKNPVPDKQASAVASKFKALFRAIPVLELNEEVAAPEKAADPTPPAAQPTTNVESPF
jgi:hypothetical protein